MLADGKIYVTNEDGVTSVVKAGPAFQKLAENELTEIHAQLPGVLAGTNLHPHGLGPVRHRETGVRQLTSRFLTILTGILMASPAVNAQNWPQWRGPSGNGVSTERNLETRWSKTSNVTWRLALPGLSGSTPIVWGEHIFLNVAEGRDLFLWAVDRNTGQPLWKKPLGGGNYLARKHNMSSPSPVTDGSHVWVMTGTGIFKGFDFKGTELWTRDIQKEYGEFGLEYGYASSPLLYEDSLYVQVLHGKFTDDPSYLLRIDKATGKTLWRVERPTKAISESPDAYTTPALLQYGKSTEIVVTGGDVATGHDPATGKELWRAGGLNPTNFWEQRIVASPVVFGETIFVPTRLRPTLAFKAGGRGDITTTHLLWTFDRAPDVPTPVSDGRYLYVLFDNGVLYCLDGRSGKIVYGPQRLPWGSYSGSPVFADGKIYVTNEDGVTVVLKAGPVFQLLAENDLTEYTLSSLAISQGQIFIRTQSALYAIGKRGPQS